MSELQNDFFLLLNIAVGGTLGGAPDATTTWPQQMLVDWIRVYDGTATSPTPPSGGAEAGIYSETRATTIPYSRIINSADWSGNITIPDEESTDVSPTEGNKVLSVDYQLGITNWGGIALDLGGADISAYSTLALSLDPSAISAFADLKIEIEDSSTTKSSVQLASYTPTSVQNWQKYKIPLSDFGGANLTGVSFLGFYSPVDNAANLVGGKLYFDNIYLGKDCVGSGKVLFSSASYAADQTKTRITVADECAASGNATVTVATAVESIALSLPLDAKGHGSADINFGATDDSTDTIRIVQGDTLTASYTDKNNGGQTDAATVAAAGPATLAGDDDGNGRVYVYASDATIETDLDDSGVDYTQVDTWSSGSVHDNAHSSDATYSPVFAVTPGNAWNINAGAVAFSGFTSGFANNYTSLHFKFKGNYTAVRVKFANAAAGPDKEIEYATSSVNAADLGNGWHEFSIRLSDFNVLATATEFAILNFGSDPFYLTDIYFE